MKKSLTILLSLSMGLAMSCAKINDRIDSLERRVDDIESTRIATIDEQVTAINASIDKLKLTDIEIRNKLSDLWSDLWGVVVDCQDLMKSIREEHADFVRRDDALEARIESLERMSTGAWIDSIVVADRAINRRIDDLTDYVSKGLKETQDWATATFATLAQYQRTADDLAALSVTVSGAQATLTQMQSDLKALSDKVDGGLDYSAIYARIEATKSELEGRIATSITASETSMKTWIATQLSGYWTAAVAEQKLSALKSGLEASIGANTTDIATAQAAISALQTDLLQAKSDLTTAYTNAISDAIRGNGGYINSTIQGAFDTANGRIDALETEVNSLKARMSDAEGRITYIEQQIIGIQTSISSLETIRAGLQAAVASHEADVATLKAADAVLEVRIDALTAYVDNGLTAYAKTDWVNATFATLTQYQRTADSLAALYVTVGKYETFFGSDIAGAIQNQIIAAKSDIEGWISEDLLSGYWDAAMTQAKLDSLGEVVKTAVKDSLAPVKANIAALQTELTQAKAALVDSIHNAITVAITANDGYITPVIKTAIESANTNIADLTTRIDALEADIEQLKEDVEGLKAVIRSISITPAYDDGSVKVKGDTLELKCIIEPAEALAGLTASNFKIYADYAEVKTRAGAYTEIPASRYEVLDATQGAVRIKTDVSGCLPTDNTKILTVALHVEKGDLSVYTTQFVNVTVTVTPTSTVTFDGGGAESGSVPAAQTVETGTAITLPGNTGSLARSGCSFTGWFTRNTVTGETTHYDAGSSYTVNGNVTMYADWNINVRLTVNSTVFGKLYKVEGMTETEITDYPYTVTVPSRSTVTTGKEGGFDVITFKDYYDNLVFKAVVRLESECEFKQWKNLPTTSITSPLTKTINAIMYSRSVPGDVLSGLFTVNGSGKQVYFSKGNLWYDGHASEQKFKFEDDQFATATSWSDYHVSHFYWSKTASIAYAKSYSDDSASTDDVFFTNDPEDATKPNASFTVNGNTGIWRTLSADEWKYLLNTRTVNGATGKGNTCVWATVSGKKGLIIFCDGYAGDTGGLTEIPDGCVFLRAANNRVPTSSDIGNVDISGYYWSSSPGSGDDKEGAFGINFDYLGINPNYNVAGWRNIGRTVRLVKDAE